MSVPLPHAAAAPAVETRSLSVEYRAGRRKIAALRDVSLALAEGELVGLVGPNGSGKTTLVRAITKAVTPAAGVVRVCGQDVSRLRQSFLARQVAVVPQDPSLPEGFSAFECVLMGRTPHLRLLQNEGQEDIAAAQRAMAATDTLELASRPVSELSGGERQRVAVARALAQETPVLLLDEPTAHLDIGHQVSVLELVRSLCREKGKAVLAVVHDLTLAGQYCDRLVMLSGGAVVAEGEPGDVLREELLSQVYEAAVTVLPHPQTGRPVVAPSAPAG